MQIDLLDESVEEELEYVEDIDSILFVDQHKEYPTHFAVNSYDPFYIHKLQDIVDPWRAVSVTRFQELVERGEQEGYNRIVFLNDPKPLFSRFEHIHDPYPLELNVELFPFQVEGFNFAKDQRSTIFCWSTGVGKSVLASAQAKYLLVNDLIDKVVVASKNHNKTNWKTQLMKIANLDSKVADSPGKDATTQREGRTKIYNESQIFIVNYEKFRIRNLKNPQTGGDGQEIMAALKGKRVLFIWDEGPSKLGNTQTLHYKGITLILKSIKDKYQSVLSATPVEKSPENVYAFVKLLDPTIFPTKSGFRNRYVGSWSPFNKFEVATWDMEKLPELGLKLAHMTHRADRFKDPEIRAQFPEKHVEDIDIDWSDQDRKLYDSITGQIEAQFLSEKHDYSKLLAQIQVLQYVCNNPLSIELAQGELAQFIRETVPLTDKYCAKLEVLRDLISQTEGKIIIYSAFNSIGAQMLTPYLGKWGYSFVRYTGKQEEEDKFKNEDIKIFVSSDLGSDSLNLREAQTVINYDLPWKYTTHHQREGRHDRIDSEFENVFVYNLMMTDSIEVRKKMVIGRKEAYQHQIFSGAIADQSESLSMTTKDLWYILTGKD